jgi:hypothetical protein
MNKTRNRSPADTEVIAVLIAISHVSARLARNLSILAADSQPWKEVKRMSKMAEMDQTIRELRDAAAAINSAADWLYQQFSGSEDEPASDTTPEAKPSLSRRSRLKLEDVRAGIGRQVSRRLHGRDQGAAPEVRCKQALGSRSEGHYEALL